MSCQNWYQQILDVSEVHVRNLYVLFILECLVLIIMFPPTSSSEDRPKRIRVVGDRSYAPFEYLEGNEVKGLLVDLWKKWSEKTGVEVNYLLDDWNLSQEKVKRGEAEAIGGIMPAPGRDKYYDFVRVIMSIEEYVYFKESMFGATKTFTFSELSLYEVGIVDEDAAVLLYRSKIPNPNKQPKLYGSYEDLVKGAVAGEVSIFLMEQPVARYWLDKYDKNRSYIRSPTFLFTEQQYVAVRKGDSQLARLIRDGF